jgi:hypothetical protein
MNVIANPSTFTVAPGATQPVEFTLSRGTASLGQWAKGSITFASSAHSVRIPVAVRPVAIKAPAQITGAVPAGTATFNVTPGFDGTLDTSVSGLVGATPVSSSVVNGPFAPPTVDAATKAFTLTVAPNTPLARFDVDAANNADDLDLYVYKDGALFDLSASAAGDEQVTLTDPPAGVYTAYVNGFDTAAGGGVFKYTAWAVPSAAVGNLTVSDNVPVTSGTQATLTASWTGLTVGQRYLGYIGYATSPERTVVAIG